MKQILVTVGFTGASGGLVNVVIQGVKVNFNYDIDKNHAPDTRNFHLLPDTYLIKVHGITGGTCFVKVSGDVVSPVDESLAGPNIFIGKAFIVN